MSSPAIPGTARWGSFGPQIASDPMFHLQSHLRRCLDSRGKLFELHCVGEKVRGALAPRFITTLGAAALLGYAASALI